MKITLTLFVILAFSNAYGICLNPTEGVQTSTITHPDLKENSGIDFSNQHQDIFWTLNDGKKAEIYAIGIDGTNYGKYGIKGAKKEDWEDIALARCIHNSSKDCIYIADTGNNSMTRTDFIIYVVEEPADFKIGGKLELVESITFKVNGKHEFEALVFNENKQEMYLVSKNEELTSVFSLKKGSPAAELIATLNFNQLTIPVKAKDKIVTAADFDNASQTLLLGTSDNAFEIKISELPEFKEKVRKIKIPKMKQTEAIAYHSSNGKLSVVATSEGKNQPLYKITCE